jgi:hypothetical protein
MVDTQFAEKEFRGRNPIGQHIWTGGTPPERESDWMEIIGVVDHINTLGPGQPSLPQIYWPTQQTIPQSMGFVVRAEREPTVIVSSLRAALREVADDLSMAHVRTMDQLFASNIANQRLVVKLLGAFAALALLLAGVGLYGVVSYSVSQRTREIGIRIALGATSRSVVHMTMQQGAKLASAGLVIGLAAAFRNKPARSPDLRGGGGWAARGRRPRLLAAGSEGGEGQSDRGLAGGVRRSARTLPD